MKGFLTLALATVGTLTLYFNTTSPEIGNDPSIQVPTSRNLNVALTQFTDPKVVESKPPGSDTMMMPSSIHDHGGPSTILSLPTIPDSLSWTQVPQHERDETPRCISSKNDFPLDRCCIGQCRRDRLKPWYRPHKKAFNNLFLKADMDGLTSMDTTLELLHNYMVRKRLERIRAHDNFVGTEMTSSPFPIIDTCSLWFIGDSLNEENAIAALCKLASLGYEVVDPEECDLTKAGFKGHCDMALPESAHCPKIRVRSDWAPSWGRYESDRLSRMNEAGPVIYSWGVHGNSREDVSEWMVNKFQPLYDDFQNTIYQPSRYAFMWREHEPQHFSSEGGVYDGGLTKCQPPSGDVYNNYRNEMIVEYLRDNGLIHTIPILKTYDALKPLHMFHFEKDCTHYCYSPWRYDLTWHGISLGLLKVLGEDTAVTA